MIAFAPSASRLENTRRVRGRGREGGRRGGGRQGGRRRRMGGREERGSIWIYYDSLYEYAYHVWEDCFQRDTQDLMVTTLGHSYHIYD